MAKKILTIILIFALQNIHAQSKDSIIKLTPVKIKGYKTINGVGHLFDTKDGIIYAGKKNEVILTDSLDANKAINNTRQILGRIPGLNIVETESSGFTANGIATRGLNPIQSIEMNTRQNGYNISADVYGYNEAYYIPPMEAVKRIEMVRGAASLQFGAHFGGLINYITETAPETKRFQALSANTVGSFGLINTFNSIGGNNKKLSYYSYIQIRKIEGYRPNSKQTQTSAYAHIKYTVNPNINIGIEYSLLRNTIQMPGGLTDKQFHENDRISTRGRNWLKSPWNVLNTYFNYSKASTTLSFKATYIFSNRSLVWKNEDGGPQAKDTINTFTGTYDPREVGVENMHSLALETRISHSYTLTKIHGVLAAGVRLSYGKFKRLGGGEGTTNSDFDLSIKGPWGYDLNFATSNLAPFAENIFYLGKKLSVTPGFRFEYLHSTVSGYKTIDNEKKIPDESKTRRFPLFGIGSQLKINSYSNIYANISQAYRPIDYSQLEPFGVTSKINPNLKDASGFNSDLGFRGIIKNYLNFDISLFYLAYNNRIGEVLLKDNITNTEYGYRTNIANSIHKGLESYIEFNLLKYLHPQQKLNCSIFNSFAFIDAKYINGEFKGKRVEAAAKIIERAGLIFSNKTLSTTFQISYIGDAFGDAANQITSENPIAGYIPAYTVCDLSTTYKYKTYAFKAGLNNLLNKKYFTRRTDEYPGPGIIPSIGRSFYLGLTKSIN